MARLKDKATNRRGMSQDLMNLLIGSLPNLGGLGALEQVNATGQSWYDNPKLLKAHQKKRKARRRTRATMRRSRRTRGQNLRTGARS